MPFNDSIIGGAPLVILGYQRLTPDNVTPLPATVPPGGCKFIGFTCENNPIRWLAGPNVALLTSQIGNPLPITWAQAIFEYIMQANNPPSFISQLDSAVVNITFYG